MEVFKKRKEEGNAKSCNPEMKKMTWSKKEESHCRGTPWINTLVACCEIIPFAFSVFIAVKKAR